MYWWLYPSRIVVFILLPVYLGCAWMSDDSYALYKQPQNYISGEAFWAGLLGLIGFAVASWCAEPRTFPKVSKPQISPKVLNGVLVLLYVIVLTAYAIFLFPALTHPALVRDLAEGSQTAMFDLRDTLNRIPGITTFTTLQSLCVVLHIGYKHFTGHRPPRRYNYLLGMLVVACVLRAWLWSERLALVEFALPMIIMKIALPSASRKKWLAIAPVFGLVGMFALFSAGEYFRSWQFYQHTWNGTFIGFAWARFAGYYATALNNGAVLFRYLAPSYFPVNTAVWFYKFPLWNLLGITFEANLAYDKPALLAFLQNYANEEFFNPSGIFMPFFDYGFLLGLICWIVLGLISGSLLSAFSNSGLLGSVLYPVWYMGVLEILRVFYWGDSRFFPVLVASLLIAAYLKRHSLKIPPPHAEHL